MGDNGCGKTTLTKLIMGILKTSSGSINIDGKDINKYELHETGRKVGYVFQNPEYQIFTPKIDDELGFAMKYKGVNERIIQSKTDEMAEMFSLNECRNVSTYNLSQGEKRRLAIACMLLNDPEYIVLDEPTSGLDTLRKRELMEMLKKINLQGTGILIVSHDDEIKEYANRILTMKSGKIYEE